MSLPPAFAPIHLRIGIAYRFLEVGNIGKIAKSPRNSYRHRFLDAVEFYATQQVFKSGHPCLGHFRIHADHNYEKFVAAPPIDQVFCPYYVAYRTDDDPDRRVARGMSKTIVDILKSVNVKKTHTAGNRGTVFVTLANKSIERVSVERGSQRIGMDKLLEALVCIL